jgi:hypothetical protein
LLVVVVVVVVMVAVVTAGAYKAPSMFLALSTLLLSCLWL